MTYRYEVGQRVSCKMCNVVPLGPSTVLERLPDKTQPMYKVQSDDGGMYPLYEHELSTIQEKG